MLAYECCKTLHNTFLKNEIFCNIQSYYKHTAQKNEVFH